MEWGTHRSSDGRYPELKPRSGLLFSIKLCINTCLDPDSTRRSMVTTPLLGRTLPRQLRSHRHAKTLFSDESFRHKSHTLANTLDVGRSWKRYRTDVELLYILPLTTASPLVIVPPHSFTCFAPLRPGVGQTDTCDKGQTRSTPVNRPDPPVQSARQPM